MAKKTPPLPPASPSAAAPLPATASASTAVPAPTKKRRRSGPSGPTKTKEQRRAVDRRRLDVWLEKEDAAMFAELLVGTTQKEVVSMAIRLAYEKHKKASGK